MKNKEFMIRSYDNELHKFVIGDSCIGEGYSGMTDGVLVSGELIEVNQQLDSAEIFSDKFQMPCAIKLRTLKLNNK